MEGNRETLTRLSSCADGGANRPHESPVAVSLSDVKGREAEWVAVREAWRAALSSGLTEQWMTAALALSSMNAESSRDVTENG